MPPGKWLIAGAIGAVVIALGAAALARELVASSSPDSASPKKRPPKARAFVRYADRQAGFSISYPSRWRRLQSGDNQVRLLVAGGGASVLVRTAPLGVRVRPENLKRAKKITDNLVKVAGGVKPLRRPQQVRMGGLPGYLYIYSFRDRGTGERGAHAHYFLFRDETMLTLVFQALPAKSFAGLAPLFQRIANSFRAAPGQSGLR